MASSRVINTNFWKDTYVIDLDPIEKLLFLYLLTNPNTNIAGIYEISLRQIAFDTGIDKDMVAKILARFQADGKAYYNRGWLALYNWIKHQSLNPKVSEGIKRIVDGLPQWLSDDLLEQEQSTLPFDSEPIHSLSKPIALNLTKLNLTKPNAKAAEGSKKSNLTPKQKYHYAMAVKADKDQAARANDRSTETNEAGYDSFSHIGKLLKQKKQAK